MHKKISGVLLLFLLMMNAYAQQPDSSKNVTIQSNIRSTSEVEPVHFKIAPFIVPAALVGYGFLATNDHGALRALDYSTRDELMEDHPLFRAHVDDYLQFAPALAVYGLNLSGIKGKHHLGDATLYYVTSVAIMGVSTRLIKKGVGRLRPDGSAYDSFPSGHTASAFAAAEFLHQEYKDVSPWLAYPGYVVAAATGTLRMYNNKHWFSDVVAGAGIGLASTKIAYITYPYIRQLFASKKSHTFTMMPYYQDKGAGMMLYGTF